MLNNILIIPLIFALGFSPYLIGVNSIMHGRAKGYGVLAIASIIIGYLMGVGAEASSGLVNLFIIIAVGSFVIATIGLAEVVNREKPPMVGLILVPTLILVFFMVTVLGYSLSSETSIKAELVAEVVKVQPEIIKFFEQAELNDSQDYFELKALVMKPEQLVASFITYGTGSFFDMVMLAIWINLFFLLRAYRLVKSKNNAPFDEFTLLNLKMHPGLKWGLLVSGMAYMASDYFQVTTLTAVSFVSLNVLAAFYFFQGFGIYLRFLDFVKIYGFIRVFLIVLTIFSARPILVLVGFADEFIDFRKLMIKEDQGEL